VVRATSTLEAKHARLPQRQAAATTDTYVGSNTQSDFALIGAAVRRGACVDGLCARARFGQVSLK
jgi:hypothetical protein